MPPDILVSTAWVAQHRHDPELRIVEVNGDTAAYEQGHIPGAVGWNWQTPLCDPLRRDILTKAQFEQLMHASGIRPTTLVFYGDNHNWFATYASQGVDLRQETVAYYRIGERSSHTWFVLKYLLGAPKVRNYDGSWTE